LADASELLVPAWEIEILALVLNQLNGPLTSDMAIWRKSRNTPGDMGVSRYQSD
jgi:hypothetical protein